MSSTSSAPADARLARFGTVTRMLSDVPSGLSPVQQRFVDALEAALEGHTFARLPADGVRVEIGGDHLEFAVRHPDGDGCDLRANADSFVGRAVAWLVDALHGRIELSATYRGDELLSTRYVRHADDGVQHGSSWFFAPAQLRVWQPTRHVRRRPSWT